MNIGIDIDDTITNTYDVIMNYAQKYTIDVLKREPILQEGKCNTHMYTQYLHNWKDGEDIKFLEVYYKRIIQEVRPKTLALEYLNKLKQEGHKLVLITARWETENFDVREETKKWIAENNIPCDKLIINAENKLIACQSENIDVFIDDSFSNCKKVADAGIKAYLMDSFPNKGLKDEKIERIYSWPHLYYKLNNK